MSVVDYFEESTSPNPPSFSIIFLHGLGASADDLRPLAPLICPPNSSARLIFLNAPVVPLKAFAGDWVRSWFDLDCLLDWSKPIPENMGLGQSFQRVHEAVLRQIESGIPPEGIFLLGFSQGAFLALYSALRMSLCIGGILALSPFMRKNDLTFPITPEASAIPLFLGEGEYDVVIPEFLRKETSLVLKDTFKKSMTHNVYPMGHEVCERETIDVKNWLCKHSL